MVGCLELLAWNAKVPSQKFQATNNSGRLLHVTVFLVEPLLIDWLPGTFGLGLLRFMKLQATNSSGGSSTNTSRNATYPDTTVPINSPNQLCQSFLSCACCMGVLLGMLF
jgi:hypothetical protein